MDEIRTRELTKHLVQAAINSIQNEGMEPTEAAAAFLASFMDLAEKIGTPHSLIAQMLRAAADEIDAAEISKH